jgi:hypothetical protein
MFFRRHDREQPPLDPWGELARRLELVDASDVGERIHRWLDLGDAHLAPVYQLRRPGLPAAYLFDALHERQGPSGRVSWTRRCCLVRSEVPVSRVSFRATARQNKVLESLEASRSGAVRVAVTADPVFDAAVSVYARDATAAAAALTPPVRRVLQRLLVERAAPDARLVVGEQHLVSSFETQPGDAMVTLEQVLADTLSLATLLPTGRGGLTVGRSPAPAPPAAITPDDLLELG